MANTLTSNPIFIDTAAGSTIEDKKVMLIEWIDDAGDIADDDDLAFTINGVDIAAKIQIGTTTGGTPVEDVTPNVGNVAVWRIGPFCKPLYVTSMVVTTIDHGVVLVWCA